MEDLSYDPRRCLTFWFRLVQSRHLQWPISAGVRVERVEVLPRRDGGKLTFSQETKWPALPLAEAREENLFQVKAAMPVPIISHDQVLFVTLRDVLDRVVARVHVTYADARMLHRGGFSRWYAAEPAPLVDNKDQQDEVQWSKVTYNEMARNENTTFRLVHYLDDGDLFALPLDPVPTRHPSVHLMSSDVDYECFGWAAAVAPDNASQLLLAGAFRLPVQAILFDTDENAMETAHDTRHAVNTGTYLAGILLDVSRCCEHDKLFVACEYASGNMCALEVPSLADEDDYTRLAFPDGSDSAHRTAVDKAGARVAVLRRLNLAGFCPAIVMVLASGQRFLEAGLVMLASTLVLISERRCSNILLVAWRMPMGEDSSITEICTRWRSHWTRQNISSHSETWVLHQNSLSIPPHRYLCDKIKWSTIFLPALLATTPRRLSPRFSTDAINQIAMAVSNRRARGEKGGYVPLGYDSLCVLEGAAAVPIQRGFVNAGTPGLSAARQAREERWRYAAFW